MNDEDPMPVFSIKGTDHLAVKAIIAYRRLCILHGLDNQAYEVARAAGEMGRWQQRNPAQVNWPSHQHVPASRGPEFTTRTAAEAACRVLGYPTTMVDRIVSTEGSDSDPDLQMLIDATHRLLSGGPV
jgi:hypothetical protein